MDGNTDMIPETSPDRLEQIALDLIDTGSNYRKAFDPEKLAELAESIRAHGVLQSIVVRPLAGGRYELIAGERRVRASRLAGRSTIPATVRTLDDEGALTAQMDENGHRQDPQPLEDAAALDRFVREYRRTPEEIAAKLKRPVQWVKRRLSLLALGERARSMLAAGDLPLAHAHLCAAVDHAAQERAISRWDGMELPSAKVFAREITAALRTLQSAPFAIDDAKLPGGPCGGCSRRTDAQVDLFGAAPDGARCTGPECWDGKVAAVWERAQKGARRRKGLAVIQDFVTLSHDHTCVVRGDVLTARPQDGEDPVAVARTAWGKVVDLWLPEEKAAPVLARASAEGAGSSGDASDPSAEDAARSAQKAQESARKAAAHQEKRATLARLYDALTGSRTGLHTGLRVALLTVARDMEMSRDLRAVCEATGRNVLVSTDADIAADIDGGDLAVMLVATIVSAWALDKDAEDGTVMERSLREMLRAREREESDTVVITGRDQSGETIQETVKIPADVTHALHPETGAVVTGDDVERITPAQETTETAEKPAAAKKAKKGGRK